MIGKRSNGLQFGRWTFKPKTLKRLYFLLNTLLKKIGKVRCRLRNVSLKIHRIPATSLSFSYTFTITTTCNLPVYRATKNEKPRRLASTSPQTHQRTSLSSQNYLTYTTLPFQHASIQPLINSASRIFISETI